MARAVATATLPGRAAPRRPGRRTWPTVLWVGAIWVGLWGDLSVANVLAGLAAGVVITRLAPLPATPRRYRPSLPGLLRFGGVLAVALVRSTADVAVRVLRSTAGLDPAVVEVELGPRDAFVLAMAANATTLTPGTLTLDVHPPSGTLRVHVLHVGEAGPDAVRADVRRFADLAEAALRPLAAPPTQEGRW